MDRAGDTAGPGRRPVGLAAGIRDAARLVWRAAASNASVQVASALLMGVLPIGLAWLSKSLLDGLATDRRHTGPLLVLAAGMVAAGLVAATVPYLLQYAAAELGRKVALLAQSELAGALKRLRGLARLEDPAFYDRLRLATQAGRAGPGQVFAALLAIGQGAVTTGGFLVTLAVLNPWLLAFAVLTAAPTVRLQLELSRRRTAMMWRLSGVERREMFYEGLLTRLDAAKEIRLFGLADFFIGRMLRELSAIHGEQRRMDRRELLSHAGMALLSAVVAGASIVWAVLAATTGRLSVGDIAIVVAAAGGVVGGLSGAIDRFGTLHQSLALFGHYRAVIAAAPDLPVPARPRELPPLRYGIVLRDVWFRYSPVHPWVLCGVNLIIPAGRAVGLVGLNGSGKSTLIKVAVPVLRPGVRIDRVGRGGPARSAGGAAARANRRGVPGLHGLRHVRRREHRRGRRGADRRPGAGDRGGGRGRRAWRDRGAPQGLRHAADPGLS